MRNAYCTGRSYEKHIYLFVHIYIYAHLLLHTSNITSRQAVHSSTAEHGIIGHNAKWLTLRMGVGSTLDAGMTR